MRPAIAGAALVALLAAGCASEPAPVRFATGGRMPDTTTDGLHRVQASRIGAAYLLPGADFSAYDAVVVDRVTVAYRSTPRTATEFNRERGNFALSDENMERLKRIFQESFERELGRSQGYSVVSEGGPSVLRASGHIVNLVVRAPPMLGNEMNFVLNAGEMTLVLDVRDSRSGEPLARVVDRRGVRPGGAPLTGGFEANAVSSWSGVRDVFEDWARILRQGLEDLQSLPPVPFPEAG